MQSIAAFRKTEGELVSYPTHVAFETSSIGPTNCQFCDEAFEDRYILSRHMDIHEYCSACELKFHNFRRWRQHFLSNHDRTNKFYCEICVEPVDSLFGYTEHLISAHAYVE